MKSIGAVLAVIAGLLITTSSRAHDKSFRPLPQPPAPSQDSGLYFTNNDKSEHAAFGALLGLAGRLQFRENRWHAMAVPAAAGVLKEIADATQHGNHFSGKDVAATLAGGLLGMVIADGAIYLTRDNGTTKVVLARTW